MHRELVVLLVHHCRHGVLPVFKFGLGSLGALLLPVARGIGKVPRNVGLLQCIADGEDVLPLSDNGCHLADSVYVVAFPATA